MQESKGRNPSQREETKLGEHGAEATSDETLSDLEENEDEVGSSSSKPDPGPSPDGALDERDEIKDAGPM
jgi:hypothetical protein